MRAEKIEIRHNPVTALYELLLPEALDFLTRYPDWDVGFVDRSGALENAQHIVDVHVEEALRNVVLHADTHDVNHGFMRDAARREMERSVAEVIAILCMLVAGVRNL